MPDAAAVRPPFVSPKVAAVLGAVATVVGMASAVLPTTYASLALIASALLAFVAGLALPQLRLAAGRPLVPLALVVPLGTAATLLLQLAAALPEGTTRSGLVLVAVVLAFVSGRAIEAPAAAKPVPLPESPAEAVAVLPEGVVGAIAQEQLAAALPHFPEGQK